ncbi:SCP-like protein [Ancylostoma ceylanicum]|uniref:SCP-like protein n=1 Tax=Ancylostoma ceylanicum TaxID=53326 RepID=A0A0D6L9Z4_9BILA|nr:SCP-like protein [Ancylostoma ceylanicum]
MAFQITIALILFAFLYENVVEATICTNPGMTDTVREAFLNAHNNYRSLLAKGQAQNGNFGYAPQAMNMQKMEYDCAAEQAAIQYSGTCSRVLSDPKTRPGYKENIIEVNKLYLTNEEVATKASDRWWRELSKYGVNRRMFFSSAVRYRTTNIVTHFAKWQYRGQLLLHTRYYLYRLSCWHNL